MSPWNQADLALALGVTPLHAEDPNWRATGVAIDSRTIQPGQIFVCVRGDRTDGHRYIAQAMQAGAAGLIVEESALLAGGLELPEPGRTTVFSVPDGLVALQDLARFHRERMSATRFYGITGSNGKTSAKEMAHGMLAELHGADRVGATRGNLNNHFGVPLTLLGFRGDEAAVVVEMGMNHAGEIELLSDLARPHLALITSIAEVHIEFFENIQGIARAKLEILAGMDGGTLVYPADAVLADVAAALARERNVEIVYNGFAPGEVSVDPAHGLRFPWRGHTVVAPAYVNPVMASNLRGVLEMLAAADFAPESLVEAARNIRPLSGRRFEVIRLPRETERPPILLVDDSYNANPASFVKSLEALRALLPHGRLICVAGEMGELGEAHAAAGHRQVGEVAGDLGFEFLAVSGGKFAEEIKNGFRARRPEGRIVQAADAEALGAALFEELRAPNFPGGLTDFDGVLVKGSRSARMDRVADALRERRTG